MPTREMVDAGYAEVRGLVGPASWNDCKRVISAALASTRPDNEGELVIDPRPDIVGSPLAKVMSYNDAHEDAVAMGYPSLTEALEHLEELLTARHAGRG